MQLTEEQKTAVKNLLVAKTDLAKLKLGLARASNVVDRRTESLQSSFRGLNGKQIIVKLPRQPAVIVGRHSGMGSQVTVEVAEVAT